MKFVSHKVEYENSDKIYVGDRYLFVLMTRNAGDRFQMQLTDFRYRKNHQHYEKSCLHSDFAKRSCQDHKITNTTLSPLLL